MSPSRALVSARAIGRITRKLGVGGNDRVRERLRHHDGPLPRIVALCRRATTGKKFNIIENRLAIHSLPNVHPALPQEAD